MFLPNVIIKLQNPNPMSTNETANNNMAMNVADSVLTPFQNEKAKKISDRQTKSNYIQN